MTSDSAEPGPSPLLRVRHALGRARRRFSVDTFDIFVRRVEPGMAEFEGVEGYEFRWAEPSDIQGCEERHTELDAHERELGVTRLEFGHKAVIALSEGTVVFSMWVNPRNLNVPGLFKRRLAPDQWFIYKAYTSPDHRGRKLYGAGMRFVLSEMARAGLERLVGYAHVKKAVSRKGLARLEFESQGRAWSLSAPGVHRVRMSAELRGNFPEAVPRSGVLPTADAI